MSKTDYDIWGETLEVNVMDVARALEKFSDRVTRSEHKWMCDYLKELGVYHCRVSHLQFHLSYFQGHHEHGAGIMWPMHSKDVL